MREKHESIQTSYQFSGFGMSQAIGHLDFYPNGGEEMPGCQKNPISQIVDLDGIWEGRYHLCKEIFSYSTEMQNFLSVYA